MSRNLPRRVHEIIQRAQVAGLERESGPIHDLEEIHDFYQRFVEDVIEACEAHAGCLVFLDPDGGRSFERVLSVGYGPDFSWWAIVQAGDGIVSKSLDEKTIRIDPDVRNVPAYRQLNPRTRSQVTLPIQLGRQYDAAFCLEFPGKPKVSRTDAEELQRLLRAFFLTSRYIIRSARIARVFNDTVRLGKTRERDSFLEICESLISYFVGSGETAIIERENDKLVVKRKSGIQGTIPTDLVVEAKPGQGYVCSVAKTRRSYYCGFVHEKLPDGSPKHPFYRAVDPRTKSQLTIPLISSGILLGVLNVGATRPHAFSASDRQLLEMVASAIANAQHDYRLAENILRDIEVAKSRLVRLRDEVRPGAGADRKPLPAAWIADRIDEAVTAIAQGVAPMLDKPTREVSIDKLFRIVREELADLTELGIVQIRLPARARGRVRVASTAVANCIRSMIYWVTFDVDGARADWGAVVRATTTEDITGASSLQITCSASIAADKQHRAAFLDRLHRGGIASKWECDYLAAQFGGYLGGLHEEAPRTPRAASEAGPPLHSLSFTIPHLD